MLPADISDRLVWIDLEMTGLDPERHHILEAACIVTDGSLRELDAGVQFVVHQPAAVLGAMGHWCRVHHARSGLTQQVRASSLSLAEVEQRLLEYVRRLTPAGECPLAGSSVHADRAFLVRHMPRLLAHMHYRIVDVSSLKELARRWRPDVYETYACQKRSSHRAMQDIEGSIEELRHYRKHFINMQ